MSSGVDLSAVKFRKKSFKCRTVNNSSTSVHILWSSDNDNINCDSSLQLTQTSSEISDAFSEIWDRSQGWTWFHYPMLAMHTIVQALSTLLQILLQILWTKHLFQEPNNWCVWVIFQLRRQKRCWSYYKDRLKGKEFWKLTVCHFKTSSWMEYISVNS